jgi:2-polyprenyl-6-methoxyphenol hydroxylase-like FAD-dependent oxidoreductase
MSRTLHHRAVVIGAGMGGLAAARALADHFDDVRVLDRDQLPATTDPRKGVPQGRHAHALLAGGLRAIAELFPGIVDELLDRGAALLDFNDGSWHQAGGYRARSLRERKVVSASRPFLEGNIRRRVGELANVRIEGGIAVESLIHLDGRVRGVKIFDGRSSGALEADLVVDCSGRASQGSHWLEEIGYAAPEVVEVRCDMRYATMMLRRRPTDLDGTFAVIIESPPEGKRAGFLIPIEGDRWIVTIASGFGTAAPTDEATFFAAAASLPSPEIADVLTKAEPIGSVTNHRLVSSKRRRYEKLKRVPAGFVALGDSICSFNPVYGQGMSSAVLQAVELGACLEEETGDEALPVAFYKRAAKVIANPWQIAVGADFAYPECTGPKPPGTDLINRYMQQVLLAAQVSPVVNTAMIMVQNLLAPPSSLLRPSMMLTVRRAARTALRQHAARTASTPLARQAVPASA